MLNLSIKSVSRLAKVGIRTLTEFEAGKRNLNRVTEATITAFFITHGLAFDQTSDGDEIIIKRPRNYQADPAPAAASKFETCDFLAFNELIERLNLVADNLGLATSEIVNSSAILIRSMAVLGLNQDELAQKLECSQKLISLMIAGQKRISPAVTERLASLIECPAIVLANVIDAEKRMGKQLRHAIRIVGEVRDHAGGILKLQARSQDPTR